MGDVTMARIGWVLSGLFAAFMLFASAAPKFAGAAVATETMRGLGWPDGYVLLIGCIEVACTLLYLVPATGLLGAVLAMALFGGAIATHLRAGSPLASHTLFSIYLGIVMWAGLWLRDPAIRRVWPVRRG
jgi:hypothetical protein